MKENGVPLVATYNPNFKKLIFLICKNLQFLYVGPKTIRVFTSTPFVSFRKVRNFKNSLVRGK